MSAQRVRLGLAIFFGVAAVLMFSRDWLWPDIAAKFRGTNLALGSWFALVMCLLNLARWYVNWSEPGVRVEVRRPLAPRRDAPPEPYEPNPELDFLRVPDADKPPPEPSANGDHKG